MQQSPSLPQNGVLALGGLPVAVGQVIPVTGIAGLTWTPAQDASGSALASFNFQVQDDGGTAHDGVDLDPTPNTITFNVTPRPAQVSAPVPVPVGGGHFLVVLCGLVSGVAFSLVKRKAMAPAAGR